MNRIICRERYGRGESALKRVYVKKINNHVEARYVSHRLKSISQFFRSAFLPQGYPESVSSDYLTYQIWDTIQAFCSSITGALAAQAVLKGVGVGDKDATVLAATMTWLIKDGTGMLGRILFAWMQGIYLDCDCKRWRLFADILNDAACFIDILAPFFRAYFTLIVCISGLCRSLVGVAGGATRAALTQHQARRNNMADVSAKDGSQETLVNLAALLCNLLLIPMVTGRQSIIWTLFIVFTGFHLVSNYKAVKAVVMETFNQARLHLVLQTYFATGLQFILPVQTTNQMEPVLWKKRRRLTVYVGTSVTNLPSSIDELERLHQIYKDCRYLLNFNPKLGRVDIILHEDGMVEDELRACFQAEVIEYALVQCNAVYQKLTKCSALQSAVAAAQYGDIGLLLEKSCELTQTSFQKFQQDANREGWKMTPLLLCADEWRAKWDLDRSKEEKIL